MVTLEYFVSRGTLNLEYPSYSTGIHEGMITPCTVVLIVPHQLAINDN